jgi:ferrous iron transport protein B
LATNNKHPDIIFLGQPNSGKSALFNAVAGLKADTSNFPGTTVKHTHSEVNVGGKVFNIIDLPGTYSLNPSDETEKVALSHLFFQRPDLIINVVDASILGRSLELTQELIELGYPMVIALNNDRDSWPWDKETFGSRSPDARRAKTGHAFEMDP